MENLEQELHNLGADFNPKTSFLKKRAAATTSSGKEKSWTLGNVGQRKKGVREKQMPMRPRSVNSTFEKSQNRGMGMGKQMGGGYATLNPNNRSFQDNNGGGSIYGRWVAHYPKITFLSKNSKSYCNQTAAVCLQIDLKCKLFIYIYRWSLSCLFTVSDEVSAVCLHLEMKFQLFVYFLRLKCQLFVYIFNWNFNWEQNIRIFK